ncbi:MAG: hypothetical protein ACTSO9_15525 [Candidatus Helarchaeota archaeon]
MESEKSITTQISDLKKKVKSTIGEVNSLKQLLQEGKITLEQFREQKNILEEKLRILLEKISQFKNKSTPEMKLETVENIKKDATFAEEAKNLMCNFQTDFLDKMSKAKVYISASLEDHFIFEIDFSNYPEIPKLVIPEEVRKLFILPMNVNLTCIKDWDRNKPPHIIDIFNELEGLLLSKFDGTFSDLENLQI